MAGVTIEELGLLERLSAACIFSGRCTLGYFLPQEKRIQSVSVLSDLSGTYGL